MSDQFSTSAPKRRWVFYFGLLVAIAAFLLAGLWVWMQLQWISERKEVLNMYNPDPANILVAVSYGQHAPYPGGPAGPKATGPWQVRMLGGQGVETIWIDGRAPMNRKKVERARLALLFPEATVADAPPQFLPHYDAAKLKLRSGSGP